jgi:FkbM family methyltransferase
VELSECRSGEGDEGVVLSTGTRFNSFNVVLNFHQANQFSARILLELLMSLDEGIETHYYLHYEDPEETLEIQETLQVFLQKKSAELTVFPDAEGSRWSVALLPQAGLIQTDELKRNRSFFQWMEQLDAFLWMEPDCVCLQQEWAKPIHEAFLHRKHPFVGQVHQCIIDGSPIATHFSRCAVYDGAAFRKLPIAQEAQNENPWKRWGDRFKQSHPHLCTSAFDVHNTSFEFLLFALYFRSLTNSNDPLNWPTNCLANRKDLIQDSENLQFTNAEIFESFYGRLPILCGVDDELKQMVLRSVRSQGLIQPRFALGGRFESQNEGDRLNDLRANNANLLSIQDLRGAFAGKRCFIIGNGPSLKQTDLTLLKHEFTFGLNRIYLNYDAMGFEPTFYCCVNPNVIDQFSEEIDRLNSVKFVTDHAAPLLKNHWNTFFLKSIPEVCFNEDLSDLQWHEGWTVTYCAMQVAFHLGFEEVILVGVDHYFKDAGEPNQAVTALGSDVNHFHPNYFGAGVVWQYPDLERSERSYQMAKEVYERNDRRILDATIGGHLQIFPKVEYCQFFHSYQSQTDFINLHELMQPLNSNKNSRVFSPLHCPQILVIDLTRIGDQTATGQMKQALFKDCPQGSWFQVYVGGDRIFKLHSELVDYAQVEFTDVEQVFTECIRFAPDVIYYRPVADCPFLHDFACLAIERLRTPTVIHIADDWQERLRYQNPALYRQFDPSLRHLLNHAFARMSICQAMSAAYRERYGVEFLPVANCIEPNEWLAASATLSKSNLEHRPFTLRYVGSLADDMTLASVLDIAKAVSELQTERSVQLELYTFKYWKERTEAAFSGMPGVNVYESNFSKSDYQKLLCSADALLIAYNFDPDSIRYVRYSMANKFPECLASAAPVLVYGPLDVATVSYAAEIGCTQLVTERNSKTLKDAIRVLVDQPDLGKTLGQSAREYAFMHHSADRVRKKFYEVLCEAADYKRKMQPFTPLTPPSMTMGSSQRFSGQLVFGKFQREQAASIDETQVVAALMRDCPSSSVMVDVGAHFGSALHAFAERGWRVYAYEPDPDNRQKLMQRVNGHANVRIDDRAVSDRPGQVLPFFSSEESTGISGLSAFRDSHQQRCEVTTTTVAQICEEHHLNEIDFLKIDTEGYDLMVLKGVPWDRIRPRIIECEFEDRKTVPLGYTFHELAQYLVDRGYTVLVSEWHPVIRYGIQHDWYRLTTYPCQLNHTEAWGNLLAFREPPDLDRLAAIAQKLVMFRSAPPAPTPTLVAAQPSQRFQPSQSAASLTHSTITVEGRNGMNSKFSVEPQSPEPQSSQNGAKASSNGKGSPILQPSQPTTVPVSKEEPNSSFAVGVLKRIARYYSRWPLGVAALAVALNTAATVDGVPYRWAFSGGGNLLMLFLVGHAASKGDFAFQVSDRAQETANRASESVARAHQKATSAFKRGTKANQRAQEALGRLDGVSTSATTALETADRARNTAEVSLRSVNQAASDARTALGAANRALGNAEFSLEIANRAKDKADSALQVAEQSSAKADSAMVRIDAAMENVKQNSDKAESILETATRNAQMVSSLESRINQVLKTNSSNVGLFQAFDRQLSDENLEQLISFWLPALNLNIDRRALGYLAHRICLTEDACSGRLATTVQDMLLRILVARSVKSRELSVLEIGALFGINSAILYETCRHFFENIHLSAIDPLDGYHGRGKIDLVTQVPVTRSVFEHNMRQMDIPADDVTLIQGLTTEENVLEKAGLRQYNLLIIDGDRSYEGVKFDFNHYLPAVNLGGYIIFDDYGTEKWPDITKFVDSEVKSNLGVKFIGASWRTAVFEVVRRNLK